MWMSEAREQKKKKKIDSGRIFLLTHAAANFTFTN